MAGVDVGALVAAVPEYREFLTFAELMASSAHLARDFPALVRREVVGRSAEGRPLELLSLGEEAAAPTALLLGVPHPNEPVGTLALEFLTRRWCEDAALRRTLGCRLRVIKCADPDGLVLNEGWLKGGFSPLRYALHYYRPPHHEQVEWSFPVTYKTLRFAAPVPETRAIMRVMERERPAFFYSLHNAGFCGVYFYASARRPRLFAALHDLVAALGLTLHRGEPEVPYLESLAPATYALFGVQATYDYLERNLGGDPSGLIRAGTSSDDYLKRVSDAFSLVCEVPYYTAPELADERPAGLARREAAREGIERAEGLVREIAVFFASVRGAAPEHRLTRSVADYLEKTPLRLAARRREIEGPAYAAEATRAEALDAAVCSLFYHLLYLGEAARVAELAGALEVAAAARERLAALLEDLVARSGLVELPLRPLVAVQAGAGLLAMADRFAPGGGGGRGQKGGPGAPRRGRPGSRASR